MWAKAIAKNNGIDKLVDQKFIFLYNLNIDIGDMMSQITIPTVGSDIELVVKDAIGSSMIPPRSDRKVITGRVLTPYRWLTDRQFCLTGDKDWPIRVMNMGMIISLKVLSGSTRTISTDVKSYNITGSNGNTYTVTCTPNSWKCTCKGFEFRKVCKHITDLSQSSK